MLALFAHGWILVNDGRYHDATYFEYFIEVGRYDILQWNFAGVAMQPWLWLMTPLMGVSSAGWILKLVEVLSLVAIGLVVLDGAQRLASFDPAQALGLATLLVAFPIYGSAVNSNTVIYFFPTALFYGAWYLYGRQALGERIQWTIAAPALALMALAFVHNPLLVFHYAFVALLLVLTQWHGRLAPFLRAIPAFVVKHAILIVLPPAFFVFRNAVLYKPVPPFDGLYAISFDPLRIGKAFLILFNEGVVLNLLTALGGNLFLLALVPAVLVARLVSGGPRDAEWRHIAAIAGFGLLFLVAAFFPYTAVGRGVPASSLGSRYFIQSGLGVALLLVAALRALPDSLRELRGPMAAALALAFALVGIDGHLMWQARWAKDRATMQALAKIAPLAPGTVVLWDDRMKIGAEVYRSFELSWFLQQAWGRQAWYPLYAGDRDLSILVAEPFVHTTNKDAYLLADFVWNGCTAPLLVEANVPRETDRQIARHYLMARFAGGKTLESYLESLVTVTVGQPTCGLTLPEKKP